MSESKPKTARKRLKEFQAALILELERAGLEVKVRKQPWANNPRRTGTFLDVGLADQIRLEEYKGEPKFYIFRDEFKQKQGSVEIWTARQVVFTLLSRHAIYATEQSLVATKAMCSYVESLNDEERQELRAERTQELKEAHAAAGGTTMTYDEMMDAVVALFEPGYDVDVRFSAYEYCGDDMDAITTNLNDVVIEGKVKFVREVDDYFKANEGAQDYISNVLENPTWADVIRCADRMIKTTGNYHHIFLESVYPAEKQGANVQEILGPDEDKSITIYHFSMGS